MGPPKVGGPSAVAQKQERRLVETLEIEEVAKASTSASHASFHIDCLPLRMDDAPLIQVPSNGKSSLSIAPVPPGVSSEG
jgi:hypothetical protein